MGKSIEKQCSFIFKKSDRQDIEFDMPESLCSARDFFIPVRDELYIGVTSNDNFSDKKIREITLELGAAIDKNDCNKIRELKCKYEKTEELKKAKDILNDKCKFVWNVFSETTTPPKEALKLLGISNKPDLEFLMGDSVKYFEKSNSGTTSMIIENILRNKNLSYTIDDIHKYMAKMNEKENCEYNSKTIEYLITRQNYNKTKLKELGISGDKIKEVLKSISLKGKSSYYYLNIMETLSNLSKKFLENLK